jgi:hypothetical protein
MCSQFCQAIRRSQLHHEVVERTRWTQKEEKERERDVSSFRVVVVYLLGSRYFDVVTSRKGLIE